MLPLVSISLDCLQVFASFWLIIWQIVRYQILAFLRIHYTAYFSLLLISIFTGWPLYTLLLHSMCGICFVQSSRLTVVTFPQCSCEQTAHIYSRCTVLDQALYLTWVCNPVSRCELDIKLTSFEEVSLWVLARTSSYSTPSEEPELLTTK